MTIVTPCVIYAAKSTEDRHDSIPDQLADCRAMAEENGWTVVGEFSDEGFTAYKGDRGPDLELALQRATRSAEESGGVCMLLAQAHDRFARGAGDAPRAPRHLVEIWIAMRRVNVHLRTVEDDYDMRDVQSVAAIGQRAMMDSRRKSRSVAKGMRRRAAKGLAAGRRSFGYRLPGNGSPMVPDAAEKVVLERIDSEFLSGKTITSIARDLHADNITTVTGGLWRGSTVAGILANPLYAGLVRADGELIEGQQEPLRSRERHDKIQALLDGRPSRGRGRPSAGAHLFRGGMLRCGCGEALVPRTQGGSESYFCAGRAGLGKDFCDSPQVQRAPVDDAVYRYFKQVALDLDATRTAFIATTRRKLDEVGALLAEAEREAQRADARLARIEGDYTDGKLEVEDWRRLRDRLAPEQEGAMAQVQRLSSHASALEAAGAEVDVETGLLRKLADIRQAIAGDVRKAKGVESVRAALIPTFETFVLHRSSPRRVHVELIGSDMWIAPILRPGAIKRHTPSGWDLPRPAALSLVADDSPTNYVWAIAVATLTR